MNTKKLIIALLLLISGLSQAMDFRRSGGGAFDLMNLFSRAASVAASDPAIRNEANAAIRVLGASEAGVQEFWNFVGNPTLDGDEDRSLEGLEDIYETMNADARLDDVEKIREKINSGISVDAYGEEGYTALQVACKNNSKKVVKLLLKKKANIDLLVKKPSEKLCPVDKAMFAGIGQIDATEIGMNALQLAQKHGNTEIMELLKEAAKKQHQAGAGAANLQAESDKKRAAQAIAQELAKIKLGRAGLEEPNKKNNGKKKNKKKKKKQSSLVAVNPIVQSHAGLGAGAATIAHSAVSLPPAEQSMQNPTNGAGHIDNNSLMYGTKTFGEFRKNYSNAHKKIARGERERQLLEQQSDGQEQDSDIDSDDEAERNAVLAKRAAQQAKEQEERAKKAKADQQRREQHEANLAQQKLSREQAAEHARQLEKQEEYEAAVVGHYAREIDLLKQRKKLTAEYLELAEAVQDEYSHDTLALQKQDTLYTEDLLPAAPAMQRAHKLDAAQAIVAQPDLAISHAGLGAGAAVANPAHQDRTMPLGFQQHYAKMHAQKKDTYKRSLTQQECDFLAASILTDAAAAGNQELVQDCLNNGVPVDFKTELGITALMKSALLGHAAVTQLLLANKAECCVVDNNGESAFDRAVDRAARLQETVSRLEQENQQLKASMKAKKSEEKKKR